MKKGAFLLVAFVVFFSVIATNLVNAKSKHYVIGVEDLEYYPLWRYDKSLAQYKGIGRRLLDEFAKSKGYTFEYKAYPIKRLVKKLVSDDIDFKFPDNPYWAKDVKGNAQITYSEPAIPYIDGVFVKPENIGKGNDSIKKLGSVLGFTPWDWLDKIKNEDVDLSETPNFSALINQAISGRIDGAYVNEHVARHHLKMVGKEKSLVFDASLFHTKSNYLLSTTQHPQIIVEFNDWLLSNKKLVSDLHKEFGMKY